MRTQRTIAYTMKIFSYFIASVAGALLATHTAQALTVSWNEDSGNRRERREDYREHQRREARRRERERRQERYDRRHDNHRDGDKLRRFLRNR